MKRVALPFAIAVGALSAALGLWLASGSLMSMGFVLAAIGAWTGFGAALVALRRQGKAASDRALGARDLVGLKQAGFPELADALERSLVAPTTSGGVERRRISALTAFREGSSLVPQSLRPGPWLSAGQPFLVSLGLFGTFVGLSYGLLESIPYIDQQDADHAARVSEVATNTPEENLGAAAMQVGMSKLLGGAKTAFSKSVAGIGLGLSYMLLWRLAQAEHRRRLERIARHADSFHEFVASEELLGERLAEVATEIRGLREAQPDGGVLASAGSSLADGAAKLAVVAERLGSVSEVLGKFNNEVIAREVAQGVRAAVEQRLAPTMDRISEELRILHDMKREQDEAVTRQLRELVDSLREQALLPIAREVAATNEQTRGVSAAVRDLGVSVAESSAAVHAASTQMSELTIHLAAFQRDALGQLNEFADHLSDAMSQQRAAFEASAESATRSFEAQTTALTSAGDIASESIRRAGTEASETLIKVRTTFAEALEGQQETLKAVLAELESSFRRDLSERAKFQQITSDAIKSVQKLLLETSVSDAELRQAAIEASNTLGKALGVAGRQVEANREAIDLLQAALADHLRAANDAHRDFLKKEDAHLADVLGKLYGLVDEIVRATHAVHERGIGGGGDARA